MDANTVAANLMLVAVLAAIVVMVMWLLVPFMLYGTKPLLRQLVAEQQRTNALLAELLRLGGNRPPGGQG